MRYLLLSGLSALVSLAALWAWAVAMPLAYMDREYASWRAKQVLIDQCHLGSVVILGDSRAAAGILPQRLPVTATNLAVGGGEAVEALAMLHRLLACPNRPRLAIVSLDPSHFVEGDLLWERSVRYGLLSRADIAELRDTTYRTGDLSVYLGRSATGMPPRLRDLLYEARFPAFSFSSLLHAAGFLRWWDNHRQLQATMAAGGQYYFGTDAGSDVVTEQGHLKAFHPLPVLDAYFNRLLTTLEQNGIDSWFIAMPVNEATWHAMRPQVRQQIAAYLSAYERRFPNFHVVGELTPHWPDHYFGDQFCHPRPEAAERITLLLSQRLQEAPPSTQNEAQNGWFSGTAAEASFKVVPSSKRGS